MTNELERNAENIRILGSIAEKLGNDIGARLIEVKACGDEFERLKTTCLAQEAEIARLQKSLDDLQADTLEYEDMSRGEDYYSGYHTAMFHINQKINRITGVKE